MQRIRFGAIPLVGVLALLMGAVLFVWGLSIGLGTPYTQATTEADPSAPTVRIGDAAPDFALPTLDGSTIQLSALQGRPVILFFWAGWCGQCIDELASLSALADRYQEHQLALLPINIMQSAETVTDLRREHGLTSSLLLDLDASVTQTYMVRVTPTYFFIDASGILRERIVGSVGPRRLEGEVLHLLRVTPTPEGAQ